MSKLITKRVTLQCRPDAAFRAFVEKVDLWWPPGHRKFKGSNLRFDPFVGGKFVEQHQTDGEFVFGEVIEFAPPITLRFSWHPGKLSAPTEVLVSFAPEGDATSVMIEHREGVAAMGDQWPERAALFDRGWTNVLSALESFIKSME